MEWQKYITFELVVHSVHSCAEKDGSSVSSPNLVTSDLSPHTTSSSLSPVRSERLHRMMTFVLNVYTRSELDTAYTHAYKYLAKPV
jgi:hypothetical protein